MLSLGRGWVVLLSSIALAACATSDDRYRREGAADPPPRRLAVAPRTAALGQTFTWGGVILAVDNQKHRTVLEVLAYPLIRSGRPDTAAQPQGRFLADRAGYLEPGDYAPGRSVTVTGDLLGYQDGNIGNTVYRFPAIQVTRLKLWDRARLGGRQGPRVGVGVNAGSRGSSVGVGVGVGF